MDVRLPDRYRVEEKLGRGATATVYRAIDLVLKRSVAIKVLEPIAECREENLRRRFRREGRVLARVRHPNLVCVYEAGEVDGILYLVLELVEGRSLEQILACKKASRAERIAWVAQVARALVALHDAGIIHRDVKPANILIGQDGKARLADVGLARLWDATRVTATGALMGTPCYMSPEQATGDGSSVCDRTDVYSLGVVLYEALTGRRPYSGRSFSELVTRIVEGRVEDPRRIAPDLSPDLERIVLRAMAPAIKRRPTAASLASLLEGHLEGRAPATSGRRRRLVAIGFVSFAFLVLAIVLLGHGQPASRPEATLAGESSRPTRAQAIERVEAERRVLDRAAASLYDSSMDPAVYAERVEGAGRALQGVVDSHPDLLVARFHLGRSWELLGDLDRAENCYRIVVDADPEFGPARYRRLQVAMTRVLRAISSIRWRLDGTFRASHIEDQAGIALQEMAEAIAAGGVDDVHEKLLYTAVTALARSDPQVAIDSALLVKEHLGRGEGAEVACLLLGLFLGPRGSEEFDQALEICPHHPVVRYLLASVHLVEGDLESAASDIDHAIAVHPYHAAAHGLRALVLFRRGRDEAAHRAIERSLELDPVDEEAYLSRARFEIAGGALEKALSDLDRVLFLRTLNEALALRALVRCALGQRRAAWNDARRSRARLLSGPIGRSRQTVFGEWPGDLPGAVDDVARSVGAAGPFEQAVWNLAIGDPGLVRELVASALNEVGEDPALLAARADLAVVRGELDAALSDYDRAIELAPEDSDYLSHRARIHLLRGEIEVAAIDAVAALEADPDAAESHVVRALVLRADDRIEDARRFASKAVALDARSIEALLLEASIALTLGDLAAAEQGARRALAVDSRSIDALLLLARVHDRRKDPSAALEVIERAIEIDANRIEPRLLRAQLHAGMGHPARARFDLEFALGQMPPDDPQRPLVERSLEALTRGEGEPPREEPR